MSTYTYDDTLSTDKDKARSQIGDTDITDALMSDEHIEAVLTWKGSVALAVAYLAQELIARFARDPIRMTDNGATTDMTENMRIWRQLAGDAQAAASGGALSFVTANYTGEATTDEFARPPNYWP